MNRPDFSTVKHRPWPVPAGAWNWQQRWYDLLFAHWPVDAELLRPLIPRWLDVDTYDGTAWIGVVPFRMQIRHRRLPGVPTASQFAEINVRTYVTSGDKAGVWFFSLDAESRLAVWGAKRFFHLPYHQADMRVVSDGDWLDYTSVRRGSTLARFAGRYRPLEPVALAKPGGLDHWLTERYCLFAHSTQGQHWRGEIHHPPWPLQKAEAQIHQNTMLEPLGLTVPTSDPVLHFARSIDVALWPLERVAEKVSGKA